MFDLALIALGPLALVAVGIAVLWAIARSSAANGFGISVPAQIARVLAWVVLLAGIFTTVTLMSHAFAVVLWILTAVVLVSAVVRYFAAERQSLLWVLTVAAERGIPLELAARAFGHERNDGVGRRAQLLADYLEAGVPLALALQRSGNYVSPAAMCRRHGPGNRQSGRGASPCGQPWERWRSNLAIDAGAGLLPGFFDFLRLRGVDLLHDPNDAHLRSHVFGFWVGTAGRDSVAGIDLQHEARDVSPVFRHGVGHRPGG